ncbi:hypothetical protein [Candidatus Enterococcus leclercqii]|uniref:hypothetical protein n=1 Tax=Candidatus Enterococcus leclercqii TaxID=1857218 RepID=UPI00137A541B|nr:hypothetical protein [Enterococcus sp. CU9D]
MTKISISKNCLSEATAGRCQTFSKQFYRFQSGMLIRQIGRFEQGHTNYQDWGTPVEIAQIFNQIKVLFDYEGRVIALRATPKSKLLTWRNVSVREIVDGLRIETLPNGQSEILN